MIQRESILDELQAMSRSDGLRWGTALLVQDPFRLNQNICQNISEEGLDLIRLLMRQALVAFEDHSKETSTSLLVRLLETKSLPSKKQRRLKQKNLKSSNLTNSLEIPGCSQLASSSGCDCYDIIMRILTEDLRMRIYGLIGAAQNEEKCESKDEMIGDGTQCPLKSSGSLKRKMDEAEDFKPPLKRYKEHEQNQAVSVQSEDVQFTVAAYANTWTNRRQQKRLLERIAKSNVVQLAYQDSDGKETTPDHHELASSETKSSNINDFGSNSAIETDSIMGSTTTSSKSISLGDSGIFAADNEDKQECSRDEMKFSELLRLKMKIIKSTSNSPCLVEWDLDNKCSRLSDYQTFIAYFKKKVVSTCKLRCCEKT